MQMDSLYNAIEVAAIPPISDKRKGPQSSWILDALWLLIDQRNDLRKLPGPLNQTENRRLTWC